MSPCSPSAADRQPHPAVDGDHLVHQDPDGKRYDSRGAARARGRRWPAPCAGVNYTAAFDAVLADAGIRTVLCNVRTPRMNAIAERWIGGCRRELLDRTLIWNQGHLRRILRQYETHHNQHRPHRSLDSAAPLQPLPEPVDLEQYRVRKHARVGGLINEYRLVA